MKNMKRLISLLLILCLCMFAVSAEGITEETHDHGIVATDSGESTSSGIQATEDTTTDVPDEEEIITDTEEPVSDLQEDESHDHTTETAAISEEETETEAPDRMTWRMDKDGTLWIGGKGIIKPITSAEEQPWKDVRAQITEVRFEQTSKLLIESIAYWFSGCTELVYVELAGFVFEIGTDAFKDCGNLEELMVYSEEGRPDVADTAFSVTNGTDLYVYVQNSGALEAMEGTNWYDRTVEIIDISGHPISYLDGPCGVNNCTCTSCTWYYKYDQYDETYHWKYAACTNCDAHEGLYGSRQAHTFDSNGICTLCGYEETVASCTHGSTYNEWSGCTYYTYCNYCGEYLGSGVSHGTYTYGAWSYYSTSQHRRLYSCSDCGEGSYQYGSHSTTNRYANYSDTQHSVTAYCATCSSTVGSTTYASHSFSYGTWSSYSSSQHRRTKACSLCDLSTYDYGTHADSNGDGNCDTCSYIMTLTVTWNASTNGGKVNGANSVTTTVNNGSTATAPSYTPTKTGHTFKGWYTASSGGSLYNTVTITAARTFYAQFAAATYTVTFDPGEGSTSTTTKTVTYGSTYGDLPVPTRGGYNFDGWFTAEEGGTQITADTKVYITANQTIYAQWTRLVSFSVTVPASLPIIMDEDGMAHTATASIINNSTGDVKVSSVSLSALNDWSIAPYTMNAAQQKVDANLIGFSIQDSQTTSMGSSETLTMGSPWQITEGGSLSLGYDAVITALSQPVSELNILSVIFILEWV